DLLRRTRPREVRADDGVPHHPLRPLREPGRARAQRHEGHARRHREAPAGPQGHHDPRPGQHPPEPHARPETVRLPVTGTQFSMTKIDVMELASVLRDAAKAEILPRFRRLEPGTVKTKSNPTDLVTEADTEAEWFIKREVDKRW